MQYPFYDEVILCSECASFSLYFPTSAISWLFFSFFFFFILLFIFFLTLLFQTDPVYTDSVSPCAGDGLGDVCHGEELISVYHSATFVNQNLISFSFFLPSLIHPLSQSGASFTPEENDFSLTMASYWLTAAKNPGTIPAPWPVYDPSTDASISFDVGNIEVIEEFQSENCDFWDGLGYYNEATA